MKKYNIAEVMQELLKDNTKIFICKDNVTTTRLYVNSNGYLAMDNEGCSNNLNCNINMKDTWIEAVPSVSFMEALLSNKKVTVEHEEIDELPLVPENKFNKIDILNKIQNREYVSMNSLLEAICSLFADRMLKDIIINGKWYIES